MGKIIVKNNIYSLYKGDLELAFGTPKEIANQINVKEKTILFYTTKTYKNRVKNGKGNRRELVLVERGKNEK